MRHLALGSLATLLGTLAACSSPPPSLIADPQPPARPSSDPADDPGTAPEPTAEQESNGLDEGALPNPSTEPPLQPPTFEDVSDTLADDVAWLFSRGFVDACGPRRFCPDAEILRRDAIAWTMRARFGDSFTIDPTKPPTFSDVPPTDPAFKYVERAFSEKIVGGYPDGTFRPDTVVPRGTMAVIVVRGSEGALFPSGPAEPYFTDVPSTHFAFAAIQRARMQRVTYGCGDRVPDVKQFCVGQLATRGSMATLLRRAFDPTFAK